MSVGHQLRQSITGRQRISLILILTLALTLIWVPVAYADGPGSLDLTFNGTGVVTTSISSGDDIGRSVALQPDGKIVVAGISDLESGNDELVVVRYQSNGSLDTIFNGTGIVKTSIANKLTGGLSVAIQPDGKIVAAGFNGDVGTLDFAVVRYIIDGQPPMFLPVITKN